MIGHHRRGGWIIMLTFIAALMLTILPLPDWAIMLRPEWVAMVLIYWCMALPGRVGVGVGWLSGLLLDVLGGTVLGQHALGLALVAFLTLKLYQRIRVFPVWQQSLSVFAFILANQIIVIWIMGIIGNSQYDWSYWLPSITSMLLWPWVFIFLRNTRRRFKVS